MRNFGPKVQGAPNGHRIKISVHSDVADHLVTLMRLAIYCTDGAELIKSDESQKTIIVSRKFAPPEL